ncbi:MMPL family transporter [Plantactinospora soyae]|uniref:RND superfamily putative drug exporter n=1 Tax=Plantactinospora soyae TaxID=1544732 RepID=A0A927R1K7_9ACTN|nr:MMPL family transporter [Plantactinospora soyae]MBE1489823.1 RND superfamily putative drug exporter [Plantactinospora soyae]
MSRHPKKILGVAALLLAGAVYLGMGAFDVLRSGGFEDPAAESTRARDLIESEFGGQTNLVLLVRAKEGTVDSPAVREAGAALTTRLAGESGVENVGSYWQNNVPDLRSADGTMALVLGHVAGDDEQVSDRTEALLARFPADEGPVTVTPGGEVVANQDVRDEVNRSLVLAEAIAVPAILLLLVLVFGSVMSTMVPLVIAAAATAGTLAELYLLGSVTDVSEFAINLATALALGLSVDYALLMVSRFRERLAAGDPVPEAVATTMGTAGRTIVFSAATVAAALAALLVFPQFFLRSFAYAGIGVVLIAAATALVVTPALLALLGHRINGGRLPWSRAARGADSPVWGGLAAVVMRRPLLTATPVVVLLLLAAAPLSAVHFGSPDQGALPQRVASRQVADTIRDHFDANVWTATDIVVPGQVEPDELAGYAGRLVALPGVAGTITSVGAFSRDGAGPGDPGLGSPDAQRLSVFTTVPPKSDTAQKLIRAIRAVPGPGNASTLVSSSEARLADTKKAIGDRLPLAGLLVGLTTFIALFLFTGSVIQPVRALLLNVLSLSATLGVMVWVFQQGHLADWLGFTPRPLDTAMTVLLLCVAFGLSMDYEVFLISRIHELHLAGHDTRTAVIEGLARTGRIVSAAAALLAISFFAFGTSSVSFLQMFGLGTGLAILIDATLVRGVLVPALMRAFGPRIWYAPRLLRRLHERVDLSESSREEVIPLAPATVER